MSHGDTSPAPVQVFYSYAHADEAHRDALREHLALLRRQGLIAEWYDRDITAGDGWRQRIDDHLEAAQLILLLISPSFMHSDYCHDIEMRRALERHANGDAWVIPIHLRPVDVTGAGFGELQALPRDARPITAWDDPDRAFADVARGIRHAIQVIQGTPAHAPIVHTALTAPVGIRWKRFIGAALVLAVLMGGGYVYSQNNPQLNRQLREAEQWLHTAQYDRAKRAYRKALAQSWGLSRAARLGLEKAEVYDTTPDGIDSQVIAQRIARLETRH
ncbi:MAG: toll/interleukin-1 receptor domain-containing protein, partial [Candidatus Tectomicrobia bacterium]